MIKKLTAGVVLLATTLATFPVYAEPAQVSAPPAAATDVAVEAAPAAPGLPAAPAAQALPAAPAEQSAAAPPAQDPAATANGAVDPAEQFRKPADAKDSSTGQAAKATADAGAPGLPSSELDKLNIPYLKSVFVDTGKIITSPIRWDKKDWLKVGLVLGATGSLFLVDQKVKDFAQNHQSHVASGFASLGSDLGNGLYTLPAVGAFYAYGALGDDHKARETSLLALESFAISGILTEGIKALGGRHRPNTGDRPMTFDGPDYMKNVSFSSGHTASAFSIATVFAEQYKDNPWVPPIAYSLAALTGLSRIYSNEHWASDVFFGGALGYFTSKALLKWHHDDKNKLFGKHLMILPQVGQQMTGVKMKFDF